MTERGDLRRITSTQPCLALVFVVVEANIGTEVANVRQALLETAGDIVTAIQGICGIDRDSIRDANTFLAEDGLAPGLVVRDLADLCAVKSGDVLERPSVSPVGDAVVGGDEDAGADERPRAHIRPRPITHDHFAHQVVRVVQLVREINLLPHEHQRRVGGDLFQHWSVRIEERDNLGVEDGQKQKGTHFRQGKRM